MLEMLRTMPNPHDTGAGWDANRSRYGFLDIESMSPKLVEQTDGTRNQSTSGDRLRHSDFDIDDGNTYRNELNRLKVSNRYGEIVTFFSKLWCKPSSLAKTQAISIGFTPNLAR